MMYRGNSDAGLFRARELRLLIEGQIEAASSEVAKMGVDVFEANSDEQICDHVCSKYPLTPLALIEDAKTTQFSEEKIDISSDPSRVFFGGYERFLVDGYKTSWSIPVSGTMELFDTQPSTYTLSRVSGRVYRDNLILTAEIPAESGDERKITSSLQAQLDNVKKMIGYVNKDLTSYDSNLKAAVWSAVLKRRQALEKIANIKRALKANINEKDKSATPLRPIAVQIHKLSPISKNKENPGWCVEDTAYQQILSSIRNMGTTMEVSRASESRDEESLRDMMLVGLNASLTTGAAGGELFRKRGKTDISILFDNKAAFVAECKLWQGEKYMTDGISQLLSYLTWRDAKTSLILFNKANQNFSAIQAKIEEIIKRHPNFIKQELARDGEWRASFTKPDDEGRSITVHVFLFDVYEGSKQ